MSERHDRRYLLPACDGVFPSPFARDRDTIFRSTAFQRLRHITQVMAPGESGRYHNRLTHSLAVARIGRALATALLNQPGGEQLAEEAGGLDLAVVEAACLAHDLGHPPFAHVAEAALDQLLTDAGVPDGFEANAQSFRVVSSLAGDDSDRPGLNLTRATLAAILKYPWCRHHSPANPSKWGVYASESEDFVWGRAFMPPGSQEPSLEATIMDWADLIAYAVYDFEDFVHAGSIPLARLAGDVAERERSLAMVFARRRIPADEQGVYEDALTEILASCPTNPSPLTSRADRSTLRCLVNHQIDQAIGSVSLAQNGNGFLTLEIDPATKARILLFEGLTWHYVIDSEMLKPQRDQQRQVIRSLFEALAESACSDAGNSRFSAPYRDQLRKSESRPARLRIVSDYLASMVETEAVATYQELIGAYS